MTYQHLFIATGAASFLLAMCPANAGTVEEAGAFACITDKWDEKEQEKGHKLVDYASRCVTVPDDPTLEKDSGSCTGVYEYMPDGSWTGTGKCTRVFKTGDKLNEEFSEGSQLKEYIYKFVGGAGKYQGASGGGTYTFDNLTDTLGGGRFKGKINLP